MGIFGEFIEGETPIDDTSELLPNLRTRAELNFAEAENIRKAVVKYLAAKPSRKQAPFDFTWLLHLHQEMFGDVWAYAGKTRKSNLNFCIAWPQVETAVQQLLDDLRYWEADWPDVVEQAAWLHHRAVEIHPFLGGNGRWSRLLANIWLKQHDHPVTRWPDTELGTASPIRNEYLAAIRAADAGDKEPFVELHRRYSV